MENLEKLIVHHQCHLKDFIVVRCHNGQENRYVPQYHGIVPACISAILSIIDKIQGNKLLNLVIKKFLIVTLSRVKGGI